MENTLKILYLRDDESYDDLVQTNMKIPGDDIKFQVKKFSGFVNSGDSCSYDLNCIFDSIIILNNNLEGIKSIIEYLPAFSVVQLCDKDSFEDLNEWIDTKFLEQFSLDRLKQEPGSLFAAIRKNMIFMKKFFEYHNLVNTILKIIPDGLTLFNLDGVILHSNSRITGYDSHEIVGKRIFDFLPKENHEMISRLMQKAIIDNKSNTFTTEVRSKEGNYIPVEVNATLINDSKGKPLYFLSILTDIRVKKEIWEKNQFLGNVVRASRDGIIVVDKDGVINLWNKGDEEIFQYSAEEMLGNKISLLCPSETEEVSQIEFLKKVKNMGYLKGVSLQRKRKDGEIIEVEINLTALYDKEGNYKGTMGIIRDISSTKKALRDVRKKNEEMEHLINTVSHDIRSPLHSIDNYLKFIQEAIKGTVTNEDVYEMLERTHANVSNIESLVQDLTDFSRAGLTTGEEVAVDLNSLINDIVANIQWQVGRKNFLITTDKLPTIRIDPGRIYQVFENLLSNAFKFRRDGQPAEAEIRVGKDTKNVIFIVRDHGIGINKKHHERIFDLFYRGKEKIVEGSGAGLAITRRIINAFGGDIWFESEPGKGSTFHFSLPKSLLMTE